MAGRRRAFLIGHPLGHSLSPAFQTAAFRAAGINATYDLADVLPDHLAATIAGLRASDIYGANVTVPYKQAVLPFLDTLSDEARALGAVNTIVNDDGKLTGLNTDVPGFAADLREQGIVAAGRQVVLLGAGGAARGVAAALVGMGIRRLVIANRTLARAAALQAQYPAIAAPTGITRLDLAPLLPDTALLVNATSAGLHGDDIPISADLLNLLPPDAIVYDLIYRPTALLRAAQQRSLHAVDGLGMLIHQGALAWEAWTGHAAPLAVMWQAARAARH
ncbi:MAG: shikimate dehydrogenase [Thermomicrobia bacterium]|nr:shikimate dehydrogenase [Thermomicrobia bacterium]MCA1723038.1 shikimate dehydrogenase [Thermomicrobia bacterium]